MKEIVTLIAFAFLLVSPVLAQPYTTEFGKGEIIIDAVKRTSDDTLLIKGSLKNTSNDRFDFFQSALLGGQNVIRIKIQDMKTKKQYEQVTVKDEPVGSKHFGTVDPGGSVKIWARVTAPPPEITEVSIIFGGDTIPIDAAKITP